MTQRSKRHTHRACTIALSVDCSSGPDTVKAGPRSRQVQSSMCLVNRAGRHDPDKSFQHVHILDACVTSLHAQAFGAGHLLARARSAGEQEQDREEGAPACQSLATNTTSSPYVERGASEGAAAELAAAAAALKGAAGSGGSFTTSAASQPARLSSANLHGGPIECSSDARCATPNHLAYQSVEDASACRCAAYHNHPTDLIIECKCH